MPVSPTILCRLPNCSDAGKRERLMGDRSTATGVPDVRYVEYIHRTSLPPSAWSVIRKRKETDFYCCLIADMMRLDYLSLPRAVGKKWKEGEGKREMVSPVSFIPNRKTTLPYVEQQVAGSHLL